MRSKILASLFLAGASSLALLSAASAQDTASTGEPGAKHHRHATASDREELLEKKVEQLEQEVQDLKANESGGEVSASQFEALQTQVYETQASVKSAAANQASVKFNHSHLTISSPDGKYTFSPIVDVMGDWASYSKGQPLPSYATKGSLNLKSSGETFRRAQIGFQGAIAGDFGYKFLYDFGGANGDETYQAYAGPNSAIIVQTCKVATSPCPAASQTTTTINNVFNSSTGAGTGPHIKEAWVSYKGILAPFALRIGIMPTPANLGDMTASDDLLFLERPSPAQLSRGLDGDDGRESVGFIGNGDFWQASAFLSGDSYGKGALIAPATTYGGGQEAVLGRAVAFPFLDPTTNFNVHLGGNFGYVIHPQEATTTASPGVTTYPITFSDRPELRVDNVTFVNTGSINARSAYAAGVEAAVSYGPFLIESENFWYGIERNNPAPGVTNPNFSGWYVEGSWVLTGEFRKYNPATASYTRPSPADPFDPSQGAWGAWELAARYSSDDFNYHTTAANQADQVFGGKQDILSAGLNFYPNDTLKFMLDFQDVTLHNIGAPLTGGIPNNGSYNTISFRGQVAF
ncbi:MAG TPA: porin [Rhizomicrobium sp.]|nr:porin [Rhizomicrobium sp.]